MIQSAMTADGPNANSLILEISVHRFLTNRMGYRGARLPMNRIEISGLWRILFILILLLVAISSQASSPDKDLQDLMTVQADIRSMEARFEQEKRLSLFEEVLYSSGRIIIEKPDFYVWAYEKPEQRVYFVEGVKAGSIDPETGEKKESDLAERRGLAAIIRSVTALITGNIDQLQTGAYSISREPSEEGVLTWSFRPRQEGLHSLFEQVTIRFDKHTRLARDLELLEQNGDSMNMKFGEWRTGVEVDRANLLQ